MKKMTKKNLMRALALLMAIIMVATSGAFSSDGWLRATDFVGDDAAATDAPAEETINEGEGAPEPQPEPKVCVDGCTLGTGHDGDCVVEIKICADGCTLGTGHDGDCVVAQAEPEPQPEPKKCADGCTLEAGHDGDCVVAQPEPEPQPEPKVCADGCTLESGHDGDCVVAQAKPEPQPEPKKCADGCTLESGHEGDCVTAQEETYKLYIKHELPSAEGTYGEETEVTLKDSDFVDGKYDVAKNAISKAGLSVKSAGVVAKENFDANGECTVTITYALANRRMVMKSTGPKGTTYLGSISDLKITEKQNVIVTLKFRYDSVSGAQADADMPIMVELSDDGKYYFNETIELPEGYEVTISNAAFTLSGSTVSAVLPGDAEATEAIIVFAAKDAKYKVVTKVQDVNGSYNTESTVTKEGKVGDLTEVVTEEREGFSLSAGQEAIKADGSTVVEVQYDRLVHYINYNTMGGSYIPGKSGLHGSEAIVYGHTAGSAGTTESVFDCDITEHTHSKPGCCTKNNHHSYSNHTKNCCRYNLEAHTHGPGCYKTITTPGTPDSWSNPAAPTKAGYTFTGWYTDAACTTKASEKAVLEGDITVYAGWTAGEVEYTIVYLKENLSGTYDYISSTTGKAEVGKEVSGSAGNINFTDKKFYHYNDAKTDKNITVKADGSTVVYVRYDLNRYNIVFNLGTSGSATMTINGTTYTSSSNASKYMISGVRLGDTISDKWPSSDNFTFAKGAGPFYAWYASSSFTGTPFGTKRFEADSQTLQNNGTNGATITYYARYATGKATVGHYHLQNADNDGYTENLEYRQEIISADGKLNQKEIYGFTKNTDAYRIEMIGDINHYHFYYTRNKYNIEYHNESNVTTKSNVPFGKNINTNEYNYTPARPADVDADYIFAGWYADANCLGDPYVFSTMPASNLALYAGWKAPEKTVTFVFNNGDANEEIKVIKGNTVEMPVPEKDGSDFVGWFANAECTAPFDANAPITSDITVYAKWADKTSTTYTVRYMDGDTVVSEKTFPGKVGATVVVRAEVQEGYEGLTIAPGRQSAVLAKEEANNVFVFQLHNANDLSYTVRYLRQGEVLLTKDTADAPAVEFSVYPTQADVTALRQLGYAIAESSKRVTFGKDAHVYVDFETVCIDFTITYKGLENATGWEDASASNPNPGTYTVETPTFGLVNPVREGYTFEGWTTTASAVSGTHNGTNVIIAKGSRGDLVFTATWKEILTPDVEVTKIADKTENVAEGETVTYTITVTNVGNVALENLTVSDSLTKDTWTIEALAIGASKSFTTKYVVTKADVAEGSVTNVATVTGGDLKDESATEEVDVKDEITVTAKSATVKYNGSEQSVSGLVNDSVTFGGATYTVEANVSAKGTDADTYETVLTGTPKVKDAAGNDVTDKFVVTVNPGTLTITKRSVSLKSATDTKEYDGTALTNHNVTVGGDGFADGDGADWTVTGSQTVVGSSENTFTYKLNDGTKAANYDITTANGTLTVTNRAEKYEITVEAKSGEFKYDGKEKNVSGFKTLEFTENGKKYTVSGITASVSKTDAGNYTVLVEGTPTVQDAAGNNVTEQFSVTVIPGTLTITKRSVTLTSATDSRVFNGTALTNDRITVDGDDFAEGEGAVYTVTGSQTYVGNSKNTFEYTLNENTNADNYEIKKVEGVLTVTNRTAKYEITVKAKSAEFKYDGTEKSVDGFETLTFEVDGRTYTVSGLTASVNGTDAGTYPAVVKGTATVKDVSNNDVTAQFTVKTEDGQLNITKRSVVLKSETAEKEYDGTALTAKEITVGGDGFVTGEGASYNVTGTQTVAGSSKNAFTYTLSDKTKAKNYEVTTVPGTLTVTNRAAKYEITVTAKSGSMTYDGQPVTMSGLEKTTFTVDGKIYTVSGLTAAATATDAGTYPVVVEGTAVVTDAAGNDVTAQFAVEKINGTLTISKRSVTLTSGSAKKEYDGTPLTNDEVTVSGNGFATGEGATYQVTGSQTYVGSSDNKFTYTLNEKTKADNYTINVVEGTLEVTDRETKYEVTLKANSGSKKYDGQSLTVSGFDKTTFEVAGNTYTVEGLSATFTAANAGTYTVPVEGTAVVRDAAGNDVTAQFTVKTEDGELVIGKRIVTLTSATDEKEFDGTPLTNSEVTVSGDGFAAGEGAVYTVSGSQTYVGNSKNTFEYTLNENTDVDNYTISKVEGDLKVTNRAAKYEVTVEANSAEYKYDGTEKSVGGFETLTFEAAGRTYTVSGLTASATGTDAGTYPVKVTGTATVKDAAGNDVTAQFTVKTVDGKLEIAKRSVILTSETASKEYDGKALTAKEISVSGDGFAEGEGAAYDVTGTQTLVGNSINTFTYTLNEGTDEDNYEIETVEGTLSVTNRKEDAMYTIDVRANSEEFLYDGTEKEVSGFQQLSYEWNGNTYTVSGLTAEAAGTDAGEYPVNVTGTAVVKDPAGNDVTKQFKINTFDGKLVINKRTVTLTSATDSKEYDGKALTNGNVSVGGDGFAKGEGAAYDVTGTQTLAGSSANTFTYTLNKGTEAGNYTITTAEGTLTVSDREAKYTIKVVANSGSKKYDGQSMTVSGFEKTTFEVAGNSYTVEGLDASATAVNAGTHTVAVTGTAVVKDAGGNDVTAQFTVETEDGKLTIGKRSVTLTSETASKEYDGTALTAKEVTVGGDGFAAGEGAAYQVTGSQTYVGSSKNKFDYTLNANTKADNYTISKAEGDLKVTDRAAKYEVTVRANSAEFKYDGTEKAVSGFETLTFEVAGNTYTVSGVEAALAKTDAGEYPVAATGKAVVTDAAGNDVTAQFTVKTENGKLVIGKRSVVMTSADAEKEYDGTALTAKEVIVSGDGFVENEGAAYQVTGTQTLVGDSENTFTYTLSEGTKASNYDITTVNGTLTVKDRAALYEITVEANSGSKKYDGQSMTVSGLKETSFEVSGNAYTVSGLTAEATGTDAGEYPVNVTGTAVVRDAAANDVTSQFKIHTVNGTLTISKRQITLTSASDNKQYDGKALTNSNVAVTGDGFATGQGAEYIVTGTQTLPGSAANAFTYTLNAGTKADNYDIATVEGTLTVTDRTQKYAIEVTANSGSYLYDGAEKAAEGFGKLEFTVAGNTYKVTGITAYKAETNAGTYPVAVAGTPIVTDAAGNDVTNQFEVTCKPGTLSILPRLVTLTSASDEKDFDGSALTNHEVTVSGDGFADGEGASYDVTGTQTLPGYSANTFTYGLNAGTIATNYEITTVQGTLTVKDREELYEIIVEANSGSKTYDGQPLTVSGLKETTFTVDGNVYTVSGLTAEVSNTDAGTYPVNVVGTAVVTDAAGNDVTRQFSVATKNGQLKIERIPVTITSVSDSKKYDGNALTNTVVTAEGFVEGQGAVYNVTGTQTLVGNSKNTFTYTLNAGTKAANYTVKTVFGTLTVTDGTNEEPVDPVVVIGKTHEDGKVYGVGETITFSIEVTNIYDEEREVTITEKAGVTLEGAANGVLKVTMAAGEQKTFKAIYTVSEEDILTQSYTNTVNVDFGEKDFDTTDEVTEPEIKDADPSLVIDKETTNPKENGFALGETIEYKITVTNDGNLTLTNVVVTDELTGDSWTIPSLAPEASEEFTTDYVVTEADVVKGSVTNAATATGENKSEVPTEVTPDEVTDDVEDPNPSLVIDKSVEDAKDLYKLGDTISYKIVVTNDGNLTLTNVEVIDELTGETWDVEKLAVGESKTFAFTYLVTAQDIAAEGNTILNVATASGNNPSEIPTKPGKDEVETPVEEEEPGIAVVKELSEVNDAPVPNAYKAAAGDVLTYTIKVTNTGNVIISDITVNDQLVELTEAIEQLEPGETKTYEVSYTVVEADIRKGEVVNTATAEGEDPKDVPVTGEDKEVTETEEVNPVAEIDKNMIEEIDEETGLAKAKWIVGDTIKYEIIVKNTGNVTLSDLTVDDVMNAAGAAKFTNIAELIESGIVIEEVDQDTVVLKSLAPEAEVKILAEYTIVRGDAGNTISNRAVVDNEEITPDEDEEPTPIEKLYNLIIHYVDTAGNTLAADYVEKLVEGEIVAVTSPVIAGYTTNVLTVTTAPDGMPAKDVEIYVVYTAIPSSGSDEDDPEPTPDPVTPEPTPMPEPVPTPESGPAPAPAPVAPPVEVSESGTYAIVEDGEGGYILTPIEEIEVPLADIDLDEHKCCILHFLITLAALIILAVYMKNQKKRQERVFELRETIELEKTKRDLGEGKAVSEAEGEE